MKRNLFVSGIMIFLALFMVGCKGNTYSKLLKKEQKKIKNYISRMDIRVVSSAPDVKQGESWPEKDYISMPTYEYFYFHLSTPLDTLRDVIHAGDVVNVRYRKYGLDSYTDTISCWTTDDAGEPITFTEAKKNKQEFKVAGRGGTDFQAPIDYVKKHPNYDGLIIITDGDAPTPEAPALLRTKLLWIIDNEPSYKQHYESLRKTGRVCLMQL